MLVYWCIYILISCPGLSDHYLNQLKISIFALKSAICIYFWDIPSTSIYIHIPDIPRFCRKRAPLFWAPGSGDCQRRRSALTPREMPRGFQLVMGVSKKGGFLWTGYHPHRKYGWWLGVPMTKRKVPWKLTEGLLKWWYGDSLKNHWLRCIDGFSMKSTIQQLGYPYLLKPQISLSHRIWFFKINSEWM